MAIKDQCSNCKSFNGDVCILTSVMPDYNQTSCEQYVKKGIVLVKGTSFGPFKLPDSTPPASNPGETETPHIKHKMFSHPFSFKGRVRRLEYGISFMIYWIWRLCVTAMFENPNLDGGAAILVLLTYIPALWFLWAQGAKRCHDRGNSGWYQLIPFYGLWMLFGDGDEFDNDYGSSPKGRNIYN